MLASAGYGYGASGGADILATSANLLSLIFILGSFVIIAYLAAKVRTLRSFQFEMFLFLLVLALSEVPHVLDSMNVVNLGGMVTYGLAIHSVSMVILSGFVAYRTYGFFKGKTNALK
ncbi:MAG: hypothetical protein LYZ66_04430 [Nitrososphaerales archaeon]|nr:hypothetical protein [Nitrososphaerales archaeon]